MRHLHGPVAVAVALLLAGCAAGDAPADADGGARSGADRDGSVNGSAEDAAVAVDPTTVPDSPDDIDAVYLQAVVDELQRLLYATDIDAASSGPLDEEGLSADIIARYRALLSPAQATAWIDSQETLLLDADDVDIYAETLAGFGAPVWEVLEPYAPGPDCVPFAYRFSLEHDQAPPASGVAALVPRDPERDPEDHNPTPWALGLHGDPDGDEGSPGSVLGVCSSTRAADEAMADADAALADR
jgi:hypothetical protein